MNHRSMQGVRAFGFRALWVVAFFAGGTWIAICNATADSFDWRNVDGHNWNSPIKSQFGGTCWDFSACGTLEAKYKLTRNDFVFNADVSEQHINWETNPDMGSMGGGWGPSVLDYFTSHGVVSEAECPAQGTDVGTAPYWPLASGWESRVWKSVSNKNDFTNDTNTMKQYLKTTGPLEVGLWAGHDLYTSVADMLTNYRAPDASGFDHEVVLVGYCDDSRVPTGGYWIIKNSWGGSSSNPTDYGNNGYYLIPYGNLEVHNDISAITGAVYYTGSMAAATWKGGSNTWSNAGSNWTNNAGGATYAWENKETSATFNASATGTAITLSGSVIAHGLTFTAGATGYNFSGGSLTVTAGGITTSEDVTFNSPMYIGGPQSWNVAAGKNLNLTGALHTIISDLTFSGAGNTTISGPIDGGGVINIYGGAKPGGLIQAGTGVLSLTGATSFSGDITATSGTFNISPPAAASAVFDGAWFGGGTVNIDCAGTFSLGGGASNFSGTINMQQAGKLQFVPADGITSRFSGPIVTTGGIVQNGPGRTILSYGSNNYSGSTTISMGALQATSGAGIPSTSNIVLDGGVLQSNSSTSYTFNRSIGTSGSNTFHWTENGGGFSAGSRAMTIRVNDSTTTPLTWGTDSSSQIVGTLKFGSKTSANVVTFSNPIDLSGADRSIQVDDNPNSTADNAVMGGAISGVGGLVKTGDGFLKLNVANSYSGSTTISGGVLQPMLSNSLPSTSFVSLNGGVLQIAAASTFTRSLGVSGGSSFQWTANGGGFSAGVSSLTVNISNDGHTLVWGNNVGTQIVGPLTLNASTATGTLTFVNGIDLGGGARSLAVNAKTVYLSGPISDSLGGASLTKSGTGTLYLSGSAGNTFTGATTILGGDLYLAKTSGYAIPGDLIFGGNTSRFVNVTGSDQIAPTAKFLWNTTGGNAEIKLLGHNQTVAGISDATRSGVIENTWNESNYAAVALTINNTANFSFNGYLRDNAYGTNAILSLTKTGTGTQTLLGGNISYTGGTTISQGKLVLQDTTNSSFLSRGIVNDGALELSASSSAFNYAGVLSGTGTLNIIGGQKLTLSGTSGNTYTGATTISGGNVTLAKTAGYAIPGNFAIADVNGLSAYVALGGSNQISPAAVATFNHSSNGYAYFELLGNSQTLAGISNTTGTGIIENTESEAGIASNGTLTINNANPYSFNGYVRDGNYGGSTGTLAIVKDGAGTLTLSGSNVGGFTGGLTVISGTLNYTGTTLPTCKYTITGGTLSIGSKTKTIPAFQITGGTLSGTGTITSSTTYDIQGGTVTARLGGTTTALTKTGPGTAILSNANSYQGVTTISDGALQTAVSNGIYATSVIKLDGGILQSNDASSATFTRGLGTTGVGKVEWTIGGGGFAAGVNALNVRIGNVTTAVNWGDAEGANIAGTLKLNSPTATNVVDFQNGINLGGKIRTIQVDDNPNATLDAAKISGPITDGAGLGGIIKTGSGTLTLASAGNSYHGGTTVAGGVLVATTATSLGAAGSSVTVQSGAQLQLGATLPLQSNAVLNNQGTIAGAIALTSGAKAQGSGVFGTVELLTGGVFSPGNSVGSVSSGSTTWNEGKYLFEINDAQGSAGSNWDSWSITGDLTISGSSPFTVALASLGASNQPEPIAHFDEMIVYSWEIASVTGSISGFSPDAVKVDTSLFQNDFSQGRFLLSESGDGKQLFLNYVPYSIPEPSSLLLLSLAIAWGVGGYCKRSLSRKGS